MGLSEDELRERLAQRHAPLSELKINKRGGSHVYRIKRQHVASYSGLRAALTGAALHTIHPVGGPGLNLAIQDSAKLAELVGPCWSTTRHPSRRSSTRSPNTSDPGPINTATIQIAHMGSMIAGPGQQPYEQAVEFYGKAASDPDWMRRYHPNFGGRTR